MEILPGTNNWKLICRRERDRVMILRAETCDVRAALPEYLWGLPVTELGHHALAVGEYFFEGEEVRVTCGPLPEEPDWDNGSLRELTLPPALERVGDYAFFNCGVLKTLRLRDTARSWGGGALMNCRALDTFFLTCTGEKEELLAYFADELPRELDMSLNLPDGGMLRLIFPEYQEIYEENCPAHHFDYLISGAGYPYHHCFRQKRLYLTDYDELWKPYLGMEHDPACALRLAFYRLRYPRDLQPRAERDYLAYLHRRAGDTVRWLLRERDVRGLAFLLRRLELGQDELAEACAAARDSGAAEAVALLLEERHRRFSSPAEKTFDL